MTIKKIILLIILFLSYEKAYAGLSLGVSGNYQKNHQRLTTKEVLVSSASLTIDLFAYARFSYTLRREVESRKGYLANTDETEFDPYTYRLTETGHFFELMLVLYAGQQFTPYIFGGAAVKYYDIYMEQDSEVLVNTESGPDVGPSYGAGLAIAITHAVSLQLKATLTNGITQEPLEEEKPVTDFYYSIGFSYKLR